jgi:HPt (histidine-containing phosphotransfer) domain-containing protein
MPSHLPIAAPVYLDTALALSQIGDVDAMNGMLLLLDEALARDVTEISALLLRDDVVNANRLLHSLKGFLPIFCLQALCDQVVEVEALSKNTDAPTLATAYAALRPQLESLRLEVQAYLLAHGISA